MKSILILIRRYPKDSPALTNKAVHHRDRKDALSCGAVSTQAIEAAIILSQKTSETKVN